MRGLSSSHGGTRLGLNPCFNGICSMSNQQRCGKCLCCLNPCFNGICSMRVERVALFSFEKGLNPCFNGICSMRSRSLRRQATAQGVLILVLMEYAQ